MPDLLERLKSALGDRYGIEKEIGRGGMAVVFLAEDLKHRRKVALKVLHPELTATLGAERFLQEIEIVAGLQHPHILPLYDSGEAEGLLYYVMPYAEGESLRHRLDREGQLGVDESVRMVVEVADGLDYAHRQGVVHRDIKPGNILLAEGHATIADFGIARAIEAARGDRVTSTGLGVGTPLYASPEQATAQETLDGRTDIYSLGCVLYEMLAGEPPLTGSTPQMIQARRLSETPTALHALRDTVPPALDHVIARALARVPADRYATASEFGKALQNVLFSATTGPLSMTPTTVVPEPKRKVSRWVRFAAPALGIAVVTAGTMLWFSSSWLGREPQRGAVSNGSGALDPDAFAVLPFSVVGDSEALANLAAGLPQLFYTKVTGEFGPRAAEPKLVRAEWSRLGGTPDVPPSEADELQVARNLAAGRLVKGTVLGTDDAMEIHASLVDIETGRNVAQSIQQGPYAEFPRLVDQLVVELLANHYGELADRIPKLGDYMPDAVQAYLAGTRAWSLQGEAGNFFRDALERDSTFVLAAMAGFFAGEADEDLARYAWEHRDSLSPRDQAILTAGAGHLFGEIRSKRDEIEAWERVLALDPDNFQANYELAEVYLYWGTNVGATDRLSRVETLAERALRQDPELGWLRSFLFEVALQQGDSAGMAENLAVIVRETTRRRHHGAARAFGFELEPMSDEHGAFGPTVEVRGIIAGAVVTDSSLDLARAATRALDQSGGPTYIVASASLIWGWHDIRMKYLGRHLFGIPPPPSRSELLRDNVPVVRDAIYLGLPDEFTAYSVGVLRDTAEQAGSSDAELEAAASARCWIGQWNLSRADTTGVLETIRHLQEDVPVPAYFLACALLLETWRLRVIGLPYQDALDSYDSLAQRGPLERSGVPVNLPLVHWFREDGDIERALEAARRGLSGATLVVTSARNRAGYDIVYLREEAPLLALVGDTAAALQAYERYLALREEANGPWLLQLDSVRAEYAKLAGSKVLP